VVSYTNLLVDESIRVEFYQRFSDFTRILKLAFSSLEFELNTPAKTIEMYRTDMKFYAKLRNSVFDAYGDKVDFRKYENNYKNYLTNM